MRTHAQGPEVVVVGAGIVGCSLALALADRGVQVVVLERSVPGAEASTVAAGILAPHVEHPDDGILGTFGEASRELHAAWAERFRDDEGLDVGFRRTGALVVAEEEALASLHERVAHHRARGVACELLDGDSARRLEPALSPRIAGAVLLPDEAQTEPPRFLRALTLACERRGVRFVRSVVRQIRIERDRVRGLELENEELPATAVVVAAGSWSALVAGAGGSGPTGARGLAAVRPVRGQLVHAEAHARLVQRLVFGNGVYIVPRGDGRYVCGATTEEAGFEKDQTLGGIHGVIGGALRTAPLLTSARLTGHNVNFRPGTPDGRPLIGRGAAEGLWIASGHYRNGILLAPRTATLLAAAMTGAEPTGDEAGWLDAFAPTRFAPA